MAKPIINLTQVDQNYEYAWVNVEFYWPSGYWGGMPFDLYMNDLLFNNENWNIEQTIYPAIRNDQFEGWNKRWDGGVTYGNTTRRLIPWTSTITAWNGNVNLSNGARAWLATNLQGSNASRGRLLERVKVYIGIGSGRINTKAVTVKNLRYDGRWEDKYCNYNSITLSTLQIPEPPTPTITVTYHNYVDDSPTIVRLTARVGSNAAGFFTLRLENIITTGVTTLTETKGATTITYDIPVNEAYYDKTFYYRARVYGADIDKVSSTGTAYVEYPMLPLWYYQSSSVKKQVRRGMYYDPITGVGKPVKVIWYNNGGSFET